MANFDTHISTVLQNEGGYSDSRSDPGNFVGGALVGTKFGISPVAYKGYFGRYPTATEMQALTEAQARTIYRLNYWDKMGGDSFPESRLTTAIFDFYVNSPKGASIVLQTLLNAAGQTVEVDGAIGSETRTALLHVTGAGVDLYNQYVEGRKAFYAWRAGMPVDPEWAAVFAAENVTRGGLTAKTYEGLLNRVTRSFPPIQTPKPGAYMGTPLVEVNAEAKGKIWAKQLLKILGVAALAIVVAVILFRLRRRNLRMAESAAQITLS